MSSTHPRIPASRRSLLNSSWRKGFILVKPVQRVMIGAEACRTEWSSNRMAKHTAEGARPCSTRGSRCQRSSSLTTRSATGIPTKLSLGKRRSAKSARSVGIQPLRIGRERFGKDLERNLALELCIGGLIHLAHAALADQGGDGIGAERGAGLQGHGYGLGRSIAAGRNADAAIERTEEGTNGQE